MTHSRLLLWVSLGLVTTLPGFAQTPTPPQNTAPVPQPTPPDTKQGATVAPNLLTTALAKLGQIQPLEARFHFTNYYANGFPVEHRGRCLTAAGRKVRYELQVKQGGFTTGSHMVSDGQQHWRWVDMDGKKTGQTFVLEHLDQALTLIALDVLGPEKEQRFKVELGHEYGFAGVLPPLQDIVDKMEFNTPPRDETLHLPERGTVAVQVLQGTWKKSVVEKIAPTKAATAPKDAQNLAEAWEKRQNLINFPRTCTLAFDKASGLPLRVEWFGPQRRGGPDVLLMRQDYLAFTPLPAPQAEPQFTLTAAENQGLEWKTYSQDELREILNLRKQVLQQARLAEEEIAKRRAEEAEKNTSKP